MFSCSNCGHGVLKNYYGGYLHEHQWMDYCAANMVPENAIEQQPIECGCEKPEGE